MRGLWFVSILLLIAAGCASIKPKGLIRDRFGTLDAGQIRDAGCGTGVKLYKATLDIRKHHLTGLLVIKRMDSATSTGNSAIETSPVYRIVFANEIGMTFFDLELKADSFKVISCFESLNKKALMKIFETDFRLLTGINKSESKASYIQSGTGNRVIEGRSGRYKTWQTFSPSADTCLMNAGKSTIADPVFITYLNYKDGLPMKIIIENPFIGMKLSLRLIDSK